MGDTAGNASVQQPDFDQSTLAGQSAPFFDQLNNFSHAHPYPPKGLDSFDQRAYDMQAMAAALPMQGADQPYLARRTSPYDVANPAGMFTPANVYHMHQASQFPAQRGSMPDPLAIARAQQQQYIPQQYGPPSGQYPPNHRQPSLPVQSPAQYARVEPYSYGGGSSQYSPVDFRYGSQPFAGGFSMPSGIAADIAPYARRSSEPLAAIPSFPRGPPRKPKQSGHALWVGNLPPAATVTDLKDHFSRDATKDIESLFLISKSNCAFVNYRTEAACVAAMNRFHDSRFQGVRLVCRLRRGSTVSTTLSASSIPTLTDSNESTDTTASSADTPPTVEDDVSSPTIVGGSNAEQSTSMADGVTGPKENMRVPEKFFIVKSLTLQDLEASVRNGIWATQSHNEASLNRAFTDADSVYLIFSANKSGEYFGYARMSSPITGEPTPISSAPATTTPLPSDGPKSITTPATETAPAGRIIDDSARGTIFWEADGLEDEGERSPLKESSGENGQDLGRPFRIEWVSTARLPFYRTRGLRNPWNANREVKIARDGTELEPSVGKRLVQMFHRPSQPIMMPSGGAVGMPFRMN